MKTNFAMSFSGGKDSTLALYRMINKGYNPVALIVAVKKNEDNSWTHSISRNLLNKVSESLNIPLLLVQCEVSEYEKKFEETLLKAKDMGAELCAFGDIDILHHRQWCEDRCKNVGMGCELPLWQQNREELVYEFIDSGFKTVIKKVNLEHLDESYLGKILTKEVAKQIKEDGSDMCGENGEYHTFVIDGPIFKDKIEFKILSVSNENGCGILNIE